MINQIKPLRNNMRDVVVTFEGEESFIVPKYDENGDINNDKYVMVSGKSEVDGGAIPKFESSPVSTPKTTTTTTSTSTPRPTSTSTALPSIPNFNNLSREELHAQVMSLGRLKTQTSVYTPSQIQVLTNAYSQAYTLYNSKFGTTKTVTTSVSLPTFSNVANMSCDGLTAEITRIENILKTSKFSSVQIADAYNKQLASAKTLRSQKCNKNTNPQDDLPKFPNFSTLSCDKLKAEITKIQNTLATSRFGNPKVGQAYTDALKKANEILKTKCASSTTDNKTPSPIGGGAIGGGGGGAIGGGGGATEETPTEELPKEEVSVEDKKSNYSWLWILLLVGGVYMLTRKGKKN